MSRRKKSTARRVYTMTPFGREQALKAFASIGYTEEDVLLDRKPEWVRQLENNEMAEGWIVVQAFREGAHQRWRGDYLTNEQALALRPELRESFLKPALIPAGWRPKPRAAVEPLPAPGRATRQQVATIVGMIAAGDPVEAWAAMLSNVSAMCAGRGSGPGQKLAFDDAVAHVGCPDRRIDRLCITCCSPSQLSHPAGHRRDLVHAASAMGSL